MKHLSILASILVGAGLMLSAAHAGDRCDNFNIMIANQTGYAAKVIKVEYFDYSSNKWRSEARIQQVIQDGGQWAWNRNLEDVGNTKTRLRISYQVKKGGLVNEWSGTVMAESGPFNCKTNNSSPPITLK